MKIIQITDLHLVPPGQSLFENDPGARLDACIADIAAHHADADLCVITGDLAHHGEPRAYQRLREALEALPVPVRLVIGNHDGREEFLAAFPETPVDADGFVQSVIDTGEGRLIFLDTKKARGHSGAYCAKRRAWLAERLAEAAGRPCYLFMHHHPLPVNVRAVDEIMLEEPEAFAQVLAGHDVRHIFFGHVHRPIAGSWRGIPFTTLRGLNHQLWLDFSLERGIPCSMEPPAYAIAFINADAVVVHTHDFLDDSPKYFYDPDLPVEQQVVRMPPRVG